MATKRLRLFAIIAVFAILAGFYLLRTSEPTPETFPTSSSHIATDIDWSRFAYIQYVTNSEYLCNALMFFDALERLHSRPERVMLVPSSMLEPEMVNSSDAYLINKARDEYNVEIVPITIQTTTWADPYTKLLAFNQTQYDRVLSIDSDSILLQHMDELFSLPPAPVAMPRAYWISPEKVLSSHVMLIKPSETELTRIMERVQAAVYGEYDMEIVNQLYRDSALMFLHRRYALLSGEFCNDNHTLYLGSGVEIWDPVCVYNEAKLIHFSDWPLPKPWKPIAEEKRLEVQPSCTRTADGTEDCTGRIIWNRLYTDFSAKRKEICDHD